MVIIVVVIVMIIIVLSLFIVIIIIRFFLKILHIPIPDHINKFILPLIVEI